MFRRRKCTCSLVPVGIVFIMAYVHFFPQQDKSVIALKANITKFEKANMTKRPRENTKRKLSVVIVPPNKSVYTNFTRIYGTPKPVKSTFTKILFPLDINLEKYVREKIEKNVDIPVEPINFYNYTTIFSPPNCDFKNSTEGYTLLVLVKSSVKHIYLRQAIRHTWGTNGNNVKVVFMLGYNEILQEQIQTEAETYNDVIMDDFFDAYANNTLKTIMGFNWAVKNCSSASMLLFIDDDHLPRMRNIHAYLRTFHRTYLKQLYCGYRLNKAMVYRRAKHQWTVSKADYPYDIWPPYLRGGAFLISQDIAKTFTVAFPYVKFLHVDDSYLGLVALKLNVKMRHEPRFWMDRRYIKTKGNYFTYNDYKTPSDLYKAWKSLSKQ